MYDVIMFMSKGLPFMINMTLPDESENYIHRIGRVGRADRMGLAISLVNTDPSVEEKVWFHTCKSRGKGCTDRRLKSNDGCTIWYDEAHLLEDVKRRLHMEEEIPVLKDDFSLPDSLAELNIVYGEVSDKVGGSLQGSTYQLHTSSLSSSLQELTAMEFETQNIFLKMQSQFLV